MNRPQEPAQMQRASRPVRVAFRPIEDAGWTGGGVYLVNLLHALRSLPPGARPDIRLLIPADAKPDRYAALHALVDGVLAAPPPPPPPAWPGFWRRQRLRLAQRLRRRRAAPPAEPPLSAFLRAQGVDAVFGNTHGGAEFRVPQLVWIPDFQMHHLPDLFSPAERLHVDGYRREIAAVAQRIVLSSRDARNDLAAFAPGSLDKARVLSFVAQLPEDVYARNPAWICGHYRLPERFVYLPNQFWKHKNHGLVIDALTVLSGPQPDVVVVCTGNTNDYRDPLYFSQLLAGLAARGLRDRLVILGLVPRAHLFALMRQSLAVLQPSLFEGWSTTVEEVKSLGKAIVLADIPVHREQSPPAALYFDPRRPDALAECLVRVYAQGRPGPDADLEARARTELPARTRAFAEAFLRIVEEARGQEGRGKG